MMAIAAALEAKGERAKRKTVLAPESAHGTNPRRRRHWASS